MAELATDPAEAPAGGEGKRVSWVELYLDLVFVLAVGQLSHLIVAEPRRSVWIVLGLFFALWWTWVGFAVLYNRHGADQPAQRSLFLAGSVPAGVAAVAIEPAARATARRSRSASPSRGSCSPPRTGRRRPAHVLAERITRACRSRRRCSWSRSGCREPARYVLWRLGDHRRVGRDARRGPRGRAPVRRSTT